MKVKIGDLWYDSDQEPIALALTFAERIMISQMKVESSVFCMHPRQGWPPQKVQKWIEEKNLITVPGGGRG